MNHDRADVFTFQIANAHTAIMGALAVKLAPQGATLDQLEHGLCGRGTAGSSPSGAAKPLRRRHAADYDRVTVPNVRDFAGKRAARTLRSLGREAGQRGG